MRNVVALCTLVLVGCSGKTEHAGSSGAPPAQPAPPMGTAPSGTSAPIVLASSQHQPWTIAIDDDNVYWTNNYGGDTGVRKLDFATRTTTVLASDQAFPSAIEVGARQVYWSNLDDGTLMTVPIEGGRPTPVER